MHKIALITFHAGWSHSSLALRSIAAFCAGEPFYDGIRIFEPLEKGDSHWLLEEVVALAPRIVGLSTYLWNIDRSLAFAAQLRRLLPGVVIVLGGPEAGPRGEGLLAAHPVIDHVIDGEGEEAFRDLARWALLDQGSPGQIAGLLWRAADGTIRHNPPRPIPPEALRSPFELGLVDFDRPLVYWETSRGCPFRCTFCSSAEDRLRLFPEGRIERELAIIAGHPGKTVKLLDRSFHLGRGRTLRLLRRFVDTPEGLRFHLELNPDRVSDEAMGLFREAPPGKFQFEIGLQSLDDAVLARIDRQMAVATALAKIAELVAMRRHPVHLDLIVGLPGESAAQCRDALDRTFRLHPDHLQLGTLKLLPGTPLRRDAARFGYLFDAAPPYEILAHARLGFTELSRFKRYAELLERLWNSHLLCHTLMHLVPSHFDDRVSGLFDALIEQVGDRLAVERRAPEGIFELVTGFLSSRLEGDPLLAELLLWDYANHTLPNRQTPPWIAARLGETEVVVTPGGRMRLARLRLSPEAAEIVNRRRLEPLAPGDYHLWPQKHLKGQPALLFTAG